MAKKIKQQSSVDYESFPEQGEVLGRRVEVCFHHDMSRTILGYIVRYDLETPFLTIIKLDDGRHIVGTECQYTLWLP